MSLEYGRKGPSLYPLDTKLITPSEFVDLIATILTARIVKRMSKAGALDKNTFGNVLDSLKGCWRSRQAPREILPLIEDKHWNRLLKCDGELLVALNLAEASVKSDTPKKRGRPRKEQKAAELGESISTPKRRPGRPRVRPIIYGAIGISVGSQASVMLVWGLILERIFTL